MYSDKVMDHFMNPRNVGEITNADGIGEVGNPVCGDMMTFYIKVDDGRIADVKFKTFGCGAAIAVSSMVSEMAIGKTVEEALSITNAAVAEALDGLPKQKLHCSNLGADALHQAIENYYERRGGQAQIEKPLKSLEERLEDRFGGGLSGVSCDAPRKVQAAEKHSHNNCPYCDAPVETDDPICGPCGSTFQTCPDCGATAKLGATHCSHCGAALPRTATDQGSEAQGA